MKKTHELLATFLIVSCIASAQVIQKPKWIVPPNIIDFTTAPPTVSPLPNGAGIPHVSANGIFDKQGNLIFYVISEFIFGPTDVFDNNGNFVGDINRRRNS